MQKTTAKHVIPAAAMEKLLKRIGAVRVSNDAKDKMREVLEEIGEEIGEKAIRMAKHAGRKTVKSSDIREATK